MVGWTNPLAHPKSIEAVSTSFSGIGALHPFLINFWYHDFCILLYQHGMFVIHISQLVTFTRSTFMAASQAV